MTVKELIQEFRAVDKKNMVVSDPEHIFALRILDKFMAGHKGFIAGGCFKNLFSHEYIKDIDVFFENEINHQSAVKAFDNSCEDGEYTKYYESKNVNAYKHKSGIVVELVKSVFGTPEEVLNMFDFTITKFAYYKEVDATGDVTYKAMYNDNFFEHLHLKRVVIDKNIPKPMSTFDRVLRYVKYGYTPCTETKQKLINALRTLPESDILVKKNFYNGID